MRAKATVEPSKILSFIEKFTENRRMPYVMLLAVYMLSTRKIDLNPSFLDEFFVEDDDEFALAVRQMIKEVQNLLSSMSLEKKQIIENILAILVPGYEKENFLRLSTQIMCATGLPFLKNKVKKNDSARHLHALFDSYKTDKKLTKGNILLKKYESYKDGVMSLLLSVYRANTDIMELKDEELVRFIREVFTNPAMMLALFGLKEIMPQTENKLMDCLKLFFAEHFDTSNLEQCSSLSKIFEVYPDFLTKCRAGDFFQKLVKPKKNGDNLLYGLVVNGETAKLKLLTQFLFNGNQASSFLNQEFVQALYTPIYYNDDQYHFSALTSLLSTPTGRDFTEKMIAVKPELFDISPDVFYRSIYSPWIAGHNWSAFNMLVIDFCANPNQDALLFSFYTHNPILKEKLSYEALCTELKGVDGFMGLNHGERCTVLGLLLAQCEEQPMGIDLLMQLLDLNPDVRKQISAKDLCRPQVIGKYKFTVYERLSKNESGRKLLAQLNEEHPELQAEVGAENERNAAQEKVHEERQDCRIS